MKIAIATPLYPPDIAPAATYVKELAKRLSASDEVTIVAYGRYPERIPGVRIIAISKRFPLPLRLILFTFALFFRAMSADVIYAQNGASAEVPATLVARATGKPFVFGISDTKAHAWALSVPSRRRMVENAMARARHVVTSLPPARPEILPFVPFPHAAMDAFEKAWRAHVEELRVAFRHE